MCRVKPVARHWFRAPSSSFRVEPQTWSMQPRARRPIRGTSRYSRPHQPRPARTDHGDALGVTPSPGHDRQIPPHNTVRLWRTVLEYARCLPGVGSPSAHSARGVYVATPGLPHPVRSASRVSHPPGGLLLHVPSGLVSSRSRPWGSPFRALLPAAEPWRLSTPAALLTLPACSIRTR
jgi:hypothetical protein